MSLPSLDPVDYVVVGHVTQDINPAGRQLGGGVTYSGLTALALGKQVGVLTAAAGDLDLDVFDGTQIICLESPRTTTFENQYVGDDRIQFLRKRARPIKPADLPSQWADAEILHLSPVANEIEWGQHELWTGGMLCLTPQGWLRGWDETGAISHQPWETIQQQCSESEAVVLSVEDLDESLEAQRELAEVCKLLVITDGASRIQVHSGGRIETIRPPQVERLDPTGAGDIFSAAFFCQLAATNDPVRSVRFASHLAAISVTRLGLEGIPTEREIRSLSEGS